MVGCSAAVNCLGDGGAFRRPFSHAADLATDRLDDSTSTHGLHNSAQARPAQHTTPGQTSQMIATNGGQTRLINSTGTASVGAPRNTGLEAGADARMTRANSAVWAPYLLT